MPTLTFAVGDIHGCLAKLERLVRACDIYAEGDATRFVFLGDYIDRGPNSRGVLDYLIRMQRERAGAVVCLRGNHDDLAVQAHRDAAAMPLWLANSGATTQRNYPERAGKMTDDHLGWLAALPYCHDDGLRFFVHAGIDLAVPLDAQDPETMMWMREPFLTRSDKIDVGRFIVHGHTPQTNGEPDLRKHRVNVDTAAVLGGPLTAAAFDDQRAEPLEFLTDEDAG
jgi:serine/threonine protein phosphatase 1